MNKTTTKTPPAPDSIAWHLERGDKAAALRKLAEVRKWISEVRAELSKDTAPCI